MNATRLFPGASAMAQPGDLLARLLRSSAFSGFLVIALVTLVFAPSLRGALLGNDNLWHYAYVKGHGPFSTFLDHSELYYGDYYYRPLFVLQTWLLSQLFDLNYAGYRASILLIHVAGALVVYGAALKVVRIPLFGALLALLFALDPDMTELVTSRVSDSGPITTLSAALVVLLLVYPTDRLRWYSMLFGLLVIAPFSRENGLIITAGVVFFAFGSFLLKLMLLRPALKILATAAAATTVYLLFRVIAFGWIPAAISPHPAGFFGRLYSSHEVGQMAGGQRLALTVYTIGANFLAVFAPVFDYHGRLMSGFAILVLVPFAVTLLLRLLPASRRWPLTGHLATSASITLLITTAMFPHGASFIAVTILQAVITFMALHGIARMWPGLPKSHRGVVILAVALILTSSVVAFSYFRWRNLNLSYLGWVLLVAVYVAHGWPALRSRAVRAFVIAAILMIVAGDGLALHGRLPEPHVDPTQFANASALCQPFVPEAEAYRIARAYDIPEARVQQCRRGEP